MARAWIFDGRSIANQVSGVSRSCAHQMEDCGATLECPNCHHLIYNSDVAQEWPGLPAGAKFDPSDLQLVEHLAAKCRVGNWVMHQYHLGNEDDEKEGEYVVSKIFYQQKQNIKNDNNPIIKDEEITANAYNNPIIEDKEIMAIETTPRTPNPNPPNPPRAGKSVMYDGFADSIMQWHLEVGSKRKKGCDSEDMSKGTARVHQFLKEFPELLLEKMEPKQDLQKVSKMAEDLEKDAVNCSWLCCKL